MGRLGSFMVIWFLGSITLGFFYLNIFQRLSLRPWNELFASVKLWSM